MSEIKKRYDFVFFFDVQDGNPNGDPDAGNLPRIDAETGMGLVTDVCLKRKVRNFVEMNAPFVKEVPGKWNEIYVREKAVLGQAHVRAFKDLGFELGEEGRSPVPEGLRESIEQNSLPEGMSLEEDDDDVAILVTAPTADLKEIKDYIKQAEFDKELTKFLNQAIKGLKTKKPSAKETAEGRKWMCDHFYDIRTFGAVMSLKSAPNCGQVRGPIQMTFARSVEPIIALEHSITRMAVATEAEAEKQSGDNRTMGRKFTVPYGLYRSHGFVSAHLADQTGFSQEDLDLFWEALQNMFEHDRSAARGLMSTRGVIVFEHDTALGNKPAHELFSRVTCERATEGPARGFPDYRILLDGQPITETFKIVKVAG